MDDDEHRLLVGARGLAGWLGSLIVADEDRELAVACVAGDQVDEEAEQILGR